MQKSEGNFGNIASGCRVPQHEQKSMFDEDQTSSSSEKCKKVKEIWKHCKWLQSATAWTKIKDLIKIRPVVPEKNAKKNEGNLETLQVAAECHSINKNRSLIKMKPVVPEKMWEICETLTIGCRVPQLEWKSKFDQDFAPVVAEKNATSMNKNWKL